MNRQVNPLAVRYKILYTGNMPKTIIFGIDGADYSLSKFFMERGHLKTLAQIAKKGFFSPLISTIPPLTPQAWSSFACAVNPGKHGIFDFGEPQRDYGSVLNTSQNRKTRGFWEFLDLEGVSCAVINMPLSYPSEPIANGYMIGGMHTPDLRSLSVNSRIQQRILSAHSDYIIDVMSFWYQDPDLFLRKIQEMIEFRKRLILDLSSQMDVDVLFVVFTALDRVSHAFWGQQDFVTGGNGWRYESSVLRVYEQIDSAVGEILDQLTPERIVVMSDHGFGSLDYDVYMNNWLMDQGFLDFCARDLWHATVTHPGFSGGFPGRMALDIFSWFKFARRRWPRSHKGFFAVDWSKTRVFSSGLFGNLYVNDKKRFSQGWIDREGLEYEDLRGSLVDALLQFRHMGKNVVDFIYESSEIYHGPFTCKAPDFILNMQNYSMITRGGSEFLSNDIFATPEVLHSGNHRMEGILMLCGKGISSDTDFFQTPGIMDVVPTLFASLGLYRPENWDGRILEECLMGEFCNKTYECNIYREEGIYSQVVDKDVMQRLKKLGYIDEI